MEDRIDKLKDNLLKEEYRRVFSRYPPTGKSVGEQRKLLKAGLKAEAQGQRIPGTWADIPLPDPDVKFDPVKTLGPAGRAKVVCDDEDSTPIDFFHLFYTVDMIGVPARPPG